MTHAPYGGERAQSTGRVRNKGPELGRRDNGRSNSPSGVPITRVGNARTTLATSVRLSAEGLTHGAANVRGQVQSSFAKRTQERVEDRTRPDEQRS